MSSDNIFNLESDDLSDEEKKSKRMINIDDKKTKNPSHLKRAFSIHLSDISFIEKISRLVHSKDFNVYEKPEQSLREPASVGGYEEVNIFLSKEGNCKTDKVSNIEWANAEDTFERWKKGNINQTSNECEVLLNTNEVFDGLNLSEGWDVRAVGTNYIDSINTIDKQIISNIILFGGKHYKSYAETFPSFEIGNEELYRSLVQKKEIDIITDWIAKKGKLFNKCKEKALDEIAETMSNYCSIIQKPTDWRNFDATQKIKWILSNRNNFELCKDNKIRERW